MMMDKGLLFDLGLIQEEDFKDSAKCQNRWHIYKTVPQKKLSDQFKRKVDNAA